MRRDQQIRLRHLTPQRGEFIKDDGERVVDGHGRQVATA
jgi:arsenate reductase